MSVKNEDMPRENIEGTLKPETLTPEESTAFKSKWIAQRSLMSKDVENSKGVGAFVNKITDISKQDMLRTAQEKTAADSRNNIFLQAAQGLGTATPTIGAISALGGPSPVTGVVNVGTAITSISLAATGGVFKLLETIISTAPTYGIIKEHRDRIHKEIRKENEKAAKEAIKLKIEEAAKTTFKLVDELKAKNEQVEKLIKQHKLHELIKQKIKEITALYPIGIDDQDFDQYRKFLDNPEVQIKLGQYDLLVAELEVLSPDFKASRNKNTVSDTREFFFNFEELKTHFTITETAKIIDDVKQKMMEEFKRKSETLLSTLKTALEGVSPEEKNIILRNFLTAHKDSFLELFNLEKKLKDKLLFTDIQFKQLGITRQSHVNKDEIDKANISKQLLSMSGDNLQEYVKSAAKEEKSRQDDENQIQVRSVLKDVHNWANRRFEEWMVDLTNVASSIPLENKLQSFVNAIEKEQNVGNSLGLLESEQVSILEQLKKAEENVKDTQEFMETTTNSLVEKIRREYNESIKGKMAAIGTNEMQMWLSKYILPAVEIFVKSAERGFTTMAGSLSTTPASVFAFTSDLNTRVSAASTANTAVAQAKDDAAGKQAVFLAVNAILQQNPNANSNEIMQKVRTEMMLNAASATTTYAGGVEKALSEMEKILTSDPDKDQKELSEVDKRIKLQNIASELFQAAQKDIGVKVSTATSSNAKLQSIRSQFTFSQLQLAISTVRDIASVVPDVKNVVNTIATGMLKKTATDSSVQLLDLLFTLDACSRDPAFDMEASGFLAKIANTAKSMVGANEKLDEVMVKLGTDNALRDAMLQIQEINVENASALQLDGRLDDKLYIEQEKGKPTKKKNQDILESVIRELEGVNKKIMSVNTGFEKNFNNIKVFFPVFNNPDRNRFMFVAEKETIDYFQSIGEAKKTLLEIHKALLQLPGDLENKESEDSTVDNFLYEAKKTELHEKLDILRDTVLGMEKEMELQIKKLEKQEQDNNELRKPYINIFTNSNKPLESIKDALARAQFSDLISVLSYTNVKELAMFAYARKDFFRTSAFFKEFLDLYGPNPIYTGTKLKANMNLFLKKITTPPTPPTLPIAPAMNPDKDKQYQEDLKKYKEAKINYDLELRKYNEQIALLKEVSGTYLEVGRTTEWQASSFKKYDLGQNSGDEVRFTDLTDLQNYLQKNEQEFHTQRVMGIQRAALTLSMQNDFRNELNLINKRTGRPEITDPEITLKDEKTKEVSNVAELKTDKVVLHSEKGSEVTEAAKKLPEPEKEPFPQAAEPGVLTPLRVVIEEPKRVKKKDGTYGVPPPPPPLPLHAFVLTKEKGGTNEDPVPPSMPESPTLDSLVSKKDIPKRDN